MTVKLGFQNVSLRKTKLRSSLLSKDRYSSSLDFHSIQQNSTAFL
jgi:hypothetical protein